MEESRAKRIVGWREKVESVGGGVEGRGKWEKQKIIGVANH
jgi:hypothetical protein